MSSGSRIRRGGPLRLRTGALRRTGAAARSMGRMVGKEDRYNRWFENLNAKGVPSVGGKNASLGEMIRALKDEGVRVPDGFATTAEAYWEFLEANDIKEKIKVHLEEIKHGKRSLEPGTIRYH